MSWLILIPGLLAGLHEFPTRPDVKDAAAFKPAGLQAIAQQMLKDVLFDSVPPCDPPDFFARAKHKASRSEGDSGELRIRKIKPAGDVLHIFSHIRKTYRVQWVLLEGRPSSQPQEDGEKPPRLRAVYSIPAVIDEDDNPTKGSKTKKAKKLKKSDTEDADAQGASQRKLGPVLQWVDYEDVQHAK